MSAAIPIPLLQNLPDVAVTPAVGVDEYALVWDNDTRLFVLRAPFAGLLATGATVGATANIQQFTRGIGAVQTAEAAGLEIASWQPFTAGSAPFQIQMNSAQNTGAAAGTYTRAIHLGFNASVHSALIGYVPGQPSLLMGFEDNYYDNAPGDQHYGMEWYVEYWNADKSVQMLRPFYARVAQDSNALNRATILMHIGNDGGGQLTVRADPTVPLLNITAAATTVYTPAFNLNKSLLSSSYDGQNSAEFLSYSDTAYQGSALAFHRMRGTIAAPSNIQAGDSLGGLSFWGRVAGANTLGAFISATASAVSTGIGASMLFQLTDTANALKNVLSLSSVGVGVGVSAPATKFHVVHLTGGTTPANYVLIEGSIIDNSNYPGLSLKGGTLATDYPYVNVSNGGLMLQFSSGSSGTYPNRMVMNMDSATGSIAFNRIAAELMRITSTGNVGIGTTSPSTLLHAVSTTATTNNLRNVLTLGANVTGAGVGDVSLGTGILFQAESSTTVDQDQAKIASLWTTATHATRASALTFSTLTAGGSLTERVRIDGAGNVGIGTAAPDSRLEVKGSANSTWVMRAMSSGGVNIGGFFQGSTGAADFYLYNGALAFFRSNPSGTTIVQTTAATNAIANVLILGSNVTGAGVGAAGLGAAVLFTMETSTTADTSAASVQAIIYEATHATRKFDLVGNAYDTAIREGWRVRGNGSAPAIGFLGAVPQARIAHVADPAGGGTVDAEARSAINSILSTLELFGFHAAS